MSGSVQNIILTEGGLFVAQHIHCTVSNCHYYGEGNKCFASEILITEDSLAHQQPDSVDAIQATTLPQTKVDSCMQTCCKTFVHSGSSKIDVDGATKSQSNFGGSNRTK